MRSKAIFSSVCIGLGVLALVGVGLVRAQNQEQKEAASVPATIPAEAKNLKNPEPPTPQSVDQGKQIFSSQCTMCHGAKGDGEGDLAKRLGYKIPDFTAGDYQKTHTDGEIYYVLTHGHGKMAGEGDRLSEKVRWNLVNYIRTFGATE